MKLNFLALKMARYRTQDLLRKRNVISQRHGNHIIVDGKRCINFCSNDYLGLAQSDTVKKAFIKSVEKYGFGSGSSALLSGYYSAQRELEEKFAEFLNRDKALYFNSGYVANLGAIAALANRHSNIVVDKLCHASIIDGIKLSKAKYFRFKHNHTERLNDRLIQHSPTNMIITESVFSMNGSIAPVDKIARLAKQHNTMFLVDDAHGFGVLGTDGKGISEHYQLSANDIDCLVTPLGKALGSMGAIVSGSHELIEAILQFSRTYHYTTALPPAVASAASQALLTLQKESWRREKLHSLINYFNNQVKFRGLPLINDEMTPIKSFPVANNLLAINIQSLMLQKGFYIACIRPPTVPDLTTRIRLSLNCLHEEEQIERLLDELVKFYEK